MEFLRKRKSNESVKAFSKVVKRVVISLEFFDKGYKEERYRDRV